VMVVRSCRFHPPKLPDPSVSPQVSRRGPAGLAPTVARAGKNRPLGPRDVVPVPLDYYAVLGVSRLSSPDAVQRGCEAALANPIDAGYSPRAMRARADLLQEARDVLSDADLKARYDAALGDGRAGPPPIDLPADRVAGALVLLHETGDLEARGDSLSFSPSLFLCLPSLSFSFPFSFCPPSFPLPPPLPYLPPPPGRPRCWGRPPPLWCPVRFRRRRCCHGRRIGSLRPRRRIRRGGQRSGRVRRAPYGHYRPVQVPGAFSRFAT